MKKKDAVIRILIYFLIAKIIIIGAGLIGGMIPEAYSFQNTFLENDFLNLFAQYDGSGYLDVAKNGYNDVFYEGNGNYHWYPLYPILIKIFSYIFGYGWSAFLVANILSFIAIYLLFKLIREEFNVDIARKSVFFLLFFPTAYFFTVMYSESLFLVLILGMFLLARRGRWGYVGVLGFLACLTRIYGLVMFFPMLYMYLDQKKAIKLRPLKVHWKKIRPDVLYLFLIPLGIAALLGYMYLLTGDFLIQFKMIDKIFGDSLSFPGFNLIRTFFQMFSATSLVTLFYLFYSVVFGIIFILAIIFSFQFLPLHYAIYMLFYGLLAFSHSGIFANSRYYLMMFPAFVILAQLQKKKHIQTITRICYLLFVVLMILFVIRHVNTNLDFGGLATQFYCSLR